MTLGAEDLAPDMNRAHHTLHPVARDTPRLSGRGVTPPAAGAQLFVAGEPVWEETSAFLLERHVWMGCAMHA